MSDYDSSEQVMVPGVLRGYRAWRWLSDGHLFSMNVGYPWTRVNVAHCDRSTILDPQPPGHDAPQRGCTCGFYARHTLDGVENLYPSTRILGSIKAHGRVILGTQGLRAEKAEIEAIYLRGYSPSSVPDRVLQYHYAVPIYYDRYAFLRDFPPIPVDHLLPPEPYQEPWTPGVVRMAVMSEEEVAKIYAAITGIDPAKDIEKEQSE